MSGSDVVIVGGGIIGAACADELARRGLAVTLLERAELAAGASGRNQGLLVAPEHREAIPLWRSSLPRYLDVAQGSPLPIRLDREPVGYLLVAEDEAALEAQRFADAPVPAERVSPARLRDLEPEIAPDLAGAWLFEDGYRLVPGLLTVALAHRARANGGQIRTNTPVRALLAEGDRVRGVATDHDVLEADVVVLAAGPWSAELLRPLGLALPVTGARGWLTRVRPPQPLLTRLLEDAGRVPAAAAPVTVKDLVEGWPAADVGAFMHRSWDDTMLVGSSREAALADQPNDPGVPAAILRRAARFVPALADAEVVATWNGVRPLTPDELPMIGAPIPGLVVATGHGSEGVIQGGGTAALVGSIVAEEDPPFDARAFSPTRFGLG